VNRDMSIDISKLKNITQKLGFFRNYTSLLLPVVIVLVAGLIFIPTKMISARLKQQISKESISIGKQLSSRGRNTVVRDQWKEEHKYQELLSQDANQISLLTKQTCQRELLSYKIFPEPIDTSVFIFREYGQLFRDAIEGKLQSMNAKDCPTDIEIGRNLQNSRRAGKRISTRTSGLSMVDVSIINELCRARAQSASVYAVARNLAGYDFWRNYEYVGMSKAVKDCWMWQMGSWVIEDVLGTIMVCNAGSQNVFDAQVKRLMDVSFSRDSSSKGSLSVPPKYVVNISDAMVRPHTGRLSNERMDVVHFRVSVVVNSESILPFMQKLCSAKPHKFRGWSGLEPEQVFKHNQITILENSAIAVDREDEAHDFYRYGDDPIVGLTLICEYNLEKSGHDEIKPQFLKSVGSKK